MKIVKKISSFFLILILLLLNCGPSALIDRRVNELLTEHVKKSLSEGESVKRRIEKVYRVTKISTWLFPLPILIYRTSGIPFSYLPIVVKDDSIYCLWNIQHFNRLIENFPFNVENDSVALDYVKEYLRINDFKALYKMKYIKSIDEIPSFKGLILLEWEYGKVKNRVQQNKDKLINEPMSKENQKLLEEEVQKDEGVLLRIAEIMHGDINSPRVKKVNNGFDVFLTYMRNSNYSLDFEITDVHFIVSLYGKLEGGYNTLASYRSRAE